jgi:hypothetical protein
MNYQAFTNDSLVMMHHAARGALAVDDELNQLGQDKRFRVRETADWVEHVSAIEAEMFKRGIGFEAVKWSETPADLAGPPLQPNESNAPPKAVDADGGADPMTRLRSRITAALRIGL